MFLSYNNNWKLDLIDKRFDLQLCSCRFPPLSVLLAHWGAECKKNILGSHTKSYFLVVRPLPPPPLSDLTTKKGLFAASLSRLYKEVVFTLLHFRLAPYYATDKTGIKRKSPSKTWLKQMHCSNRISLGFFTCAYGILINLTHVVLRKYAIIFNLVE